MVRFNKFLEYSGEHAIGYFDWQNVQLRARKGISLVLGGKRECYRDAKKLPTKCLTPYAKSRCQKPNAKNCMPKKKTCWKSDHKEMQTWSIKYFNTQKVMKDIKKKNQGEKWVCYSAQAV